tara:strand:+ start:1260 stop:1574 length:315 start_codon:yes stop_codon:yes gene_type:complete
MYCYFARDGHGLVLDCQVVVEATDWGFSRFLHQVILGGGVVSVRADIKSLTDVIDEDSEWVVVVEGQFKNFVGMVSVFGDGVLVLVNDVGHRVTCPSHLVRAIE